MISFNHNFVKKNQPEEQVFYLFDLHKLMKKKKIVIFASGSGTNAQNIIEYFEDHGIIEVAMVFSNKKDAYVLERAAKFNVPTVVFDRKTFYDTTDILQILLKNEISFIILAGFLWLIPQIIIKSFPNRIVNIHPALLPKYGGKGMYGKYVHQVVLESGDKESGITIHYVNEEYDKGDIIFQTRCEVKPEDDPETLAQRVHQLEYIYYPKIIEKLALAL